MATAKKLFIEMELDWAEEQLASWKAYIDNNPVNELTDRIEWKTTKTGGAMPMVVASIEAQIKSLRDTMRDFLLLSREVNTMRAAEEAKKEAKGSGDIPDRMK